MTTGTPPSGTSGVFPATLPPLDAGARARYARHLTLPEVGVAGQQRIAAARVLIVGAGGLGSPAALLLAAAGVGRITVVDDDTVSESDLQRQILYDTSGIGGRKASLAARRLTALNPGIDVTARAERLTAATAAAIASGHDLAIDATDNFAARYALGDACAMLGIPVVHGSVDRFEGRATVFAPPAGPCYRCLFPEPPAPGSVRNCAEAGVLGVLPGIVGAIQAAEALKLLLGLGVSLVGRLLIVDALRMDFREIEVGRNPACRACATVGSAPGAWRAAFVVAAPEQDDFEITPRELAARLGRGDDVQLLDVREPSEFRLARIDGATLVPLGGFAGALPTIANDRDTVVYCHHGVRSAQAVEYMRSMGFPRARSLAGGIDRWSIAVDPNVPRY